jgi:antagonist of KipI
MIDRARGVLKVLSAGLCTLVVDLGRPRSRSLGVSVGGAADRRSLMLGNGLVGNPPDAAALEICLAGPTLTADCPVACVVYGAPFEITNRDINAGHTFTLARGEELRIGGTPRGARAYLCIRGGVLVPPVLDSRSAFSPLRAGDELPCAPAAISTRFLSPEAHDPLPDGVTTLRFLDGAQVGWFRAEEFSGDGVTFRVSNESNRMGLRLHGEALTLPAREIVSEPVCPGSVQVTPDGQCVILGVDGQTIGGYPKIAHVIAADLDRIGQLRPGDSVRFERVGIEEAEELYRRRQEWTREWLTRLQVSEILGSDSDSSTVV